LLLTAFPAVAGYHYVAETSVDGEGGDAGSMRVEGWIDGAKAKILFTESGNPMMSAGMYLLTIDGGSTLYLVNPEEETYSVWDLEAMLGSLGNIMDSIGGLMKMEVSDPQVEKLLEEDGGKILGYPTTHYRYRTAYTMEMKVMGIKRGNRFETVQDTWSTTAINDDGFFVWLRNAPKNTGFEAFDKIAEAEFSKIKGFPLKSVSTTVTSEGKKGKTSTSTSTTEVTLLDKTSVAGSTFELDPSFEEVPMMAVPGMVPADDSEEPQEEEETGGRFGKWKKKLGG
jgi:hypothetical protein